MISCYPWPSPTGAARLWVIPCLKGGLSQQNQRTKEPNAWLLSLKSWASGFRQKRFGRIFDQLEPIFFCPRKIKIPLAGRQAFLKGEMLVSPGKGILHSILTSSTVRLNPDLSMTFWEQRGLCFISMLQANWWQTSKIPSTQHCTRDTTWDI